MWRERPRPRKAEAVQIRSVHLRSQRVDPNTGVSSLPTDAGGGARATYMRSPGAPFLCVLCDKNGIPQTSMPWNSDLPRRESKSERANAIRKGQHPGNPTFRNKRERWPPAGPARPVTYFAECGAGAPARVCMQRRDSAVGTTSCTEDARIGSGLHGCSRGWAPAPHMRFAGCPILVALFATRVGFHKRQRPGILTFRVENQNPKGSTPVESHVSQRTRDMGHPAFGWRSAFSAAISAPALAGFSRWGSRLREPTSAPEAASEMRKPIPWSCDFLERHQSQNPHSNVAKGATLGLIG